MAPLSSSIPAATTDDAVIWQNLKEAIAASSGFQQWKQEQNGSSNADMSDSVDHLVRRYLRETLETLAY
ncbi:MAG: hypothetical protein AAF685_00100 [Cyanobacteria bacterium P01_C01_bin.89]